MPDTQYTGKAGHLAVMGEFCLRGYNASMPEIDKGDDVFVVNDETGAMWRLQVKTSLGKKQKKSRAFQFRLKESSIQKPQTPDLHFVFAMRVEDRWRFLIMDRSVLRSHVRGRGLGTLSGDYRQVNVTLHDDGKVISSGVDIATHMEDWNTWPCM